MTPEQEKQTQAILAKRGGDDRRIGQMVAQWDGHRSIRAVTKSLDLGLATTAYSFKLTDQEKHEAAERIAALWTLATLKGWSTSEINDMITQAVNAS